MTSRSFSQAMPRSEYVITVEQLLLRYPQINTEELNTLVELFPKMSLLETALMTTDERLSAQLEAFHEDHGHIFHAPVKSMLILLACPFVAVGMLWWFVS